MGWMKHQKEKKMQEKFFGVLLICLCCKSPVCSYMGKTVASRLESLCSNESKIPIIFSFNCSLRSKLSVKVFSHCSSFRKKTLYFII